MPIPPLHDRSGYLPPGEHPATLKEVEERFATNFRRRALFESLEYVVGELRARDVKEIWIGGSFVTTTQRPKDVDVIFDVPPSVNTDKWGELSPFKKAELKQARRVDLWKMPSFQLGKKNPLPMVTIKGYFSSDRNDDPKGLIKIVEDSP
jgi:predicted nucleotidyltransferase